MVTIRLSLFSGRISGSELMRATKLLGDYRQQKVSFAEQGADLIAMTFGQLIFPDWPLDVGTK